MEILINDEYIDVRNVKYKGEVYDIGNERNGLIELYKDGVFIRAINIKKVEILK